MSARLRMRRVWKGRAALEELFWSREVVPRGQSLTLSDHTVIADEVGRVVDEWMDYADTAFEEVTATTWVRKTFEVDAPELQAAAICIAGYRLRGIGRLAGTFNGTGFEVRAPGPDYKCGPWYTTWALVPAPAGVRRGRNELVLRATGSLVWRLFIEPSHLPKRSERSADGDRTWVDDHLGLGEFIDGEYVIRLSGKALAAEGAVTSPPVQVVPDGQTVAPAARVLSVSVAADAGGRAEVRLGRGPWLDRPEMWTAWRAPTAAAVRAMDRELGDAGPRFVQWRLRLMAAGDVAPSLRRVALSVEFEPMVTAPAAAVRVIAPCAVLPGRPFAHQRPSERLALVRERFRLDRVFARGRDEWEGLLYLAGWVGDYSSFRERGRLLVPVQNDTLAILELGHARRSRVMCGSLAFALVQVAAGFGLTGRVILRGNHLVTEFWSPVHRKWAIVDPMDEVRRPETQKTVWTPGFGGYYHRGDGVPMSAIELGEAVGLVIRRHLVWRTGRYEERAATVKRDLRWFRREISYPERNNFTDSAEPVFYSDVFRFAGHLKYRYENGPVMPFYWNYTARRGDVEWTVGETSVFLTATAPDIVLAQFRSQMPNTAWFRLGLDAGESVCERADTFSWNLRALKKVSVSAVSAFGARGPETVCFLAR